MKTSIFAIMFVLLATLSAGAYYKGERNDIRVAIVKNAETISISGSLIIEPLDKGNSRAGRMLVSKAVISSGALGFDISGRTMNTDSLKILGGGSAINVNGKKYDGDLNILKNKQGQLAVINILPMEEYLAGLVASEMPTDWPMEAIKAQAVASRSYAIFQRHMKGSSGAKVDYDIESSVLDQVYHGIKGRATRAKEAVDGTNGEILTRHGRVIKAFFHSSCGGLTEKASNVWGEKNDFGTVEDPYCARSPYNSWKFSISKPALVEKIRVAGYPADSIDAISLETKKDNPRVATISIDTGANTIYLQINDLRKMVGFQNIKSAWFNVTISGDVIEFNGRGFGHGVGLCQWGAKGMAEAGKNYREILNFYYPGVKIEKAY